jgi:hypothetical protein
MNNHIGESGKTGLNEILIKAVKIIISHFSSFVRLQRDKVPQGPWDLEEILRVRMLLCVDK